MSHILIVRALQAELRLSRERLRRRAAIVQRQEDELAVREKALGTASVDAQALQHALDEARANAARHQVRGSPLFMECCTQVNAQDDEKTPWPEPNTQMSRQARMSAHAAVVWSIHPVHCRTSMNGHRLVNADCHPVARVGKLSRKNIAVS